MVVYHYVAENLAGERVSGTLSATDEAAARRVLGAQDLTVLELNARPETGDSPALAEDELITLVETVASAAANRLPLDLALAALAEDTDDKRLALVARRLAALLQRGDSIETAMSTLERQLPAEVRGLFRAAVASGDVAGAFDQFARQRLATQRIRRRIRNVLLYPLVILLILLPLVAYLCFSVIPMFEEMYSDFGITLPTATLWLLAAARQMPVLIGGLLLIGVGIPLLLRAVAGRGFLDRLRTTTPVLGPLWTWMGQREFAAALASFLKLRLPLPDAVVHTADVLSDRNMARACARLGERLNRGQPLSASLGQSIHFDRSLVAIVGWGETNSLMPEALGIAVEVFDDRIEQHASLLQRLLPPCLLLGVATIMFFIILSLLVPLVSLIQGLSGGL